MVKVVLAFQTYSLIDVNIHSYVDNYHTWMLTNEPSPQMFDRETKGAYALEIEARDGAPSARPHSNGQPNSVTKVSLVWKYGAMYIWRP